MIHQVVSQTSTKFNSLISHLCDSLGVSRSGYYRYFSSCAEKARLKRLKEEQQRLEVIQIIVMADVQIVLNSVILFMKILKEEILQ